MQAVVMAGGEGSRLRPLTSNMPKPMLPVGNRPLVEHILELLRSHGMTDVVVTVQFLSSVIRNYLGDGSDLGISVAYSTEDVPLGTAGSVLNARDLLSGRFLVISGDALTNLDLSDVVDFHRARGAAATIVLKRMEDPLEFGIVMTSDDGRIERFLEKPTWGQVFSDTVNTGIYVLEPDVLDLAPADQPYDFSAELFPLMLDKGLPMYGYVTDAYWTDVGTIDAYLHAHYDILSGKVAQAPGFELEPGVWVGDEVDVDPRARVVAPAIIGDNARLGPGATVGPSTVIGDNVIVGDDASASGAVVLDRAHMSSFAQAHSCVIGRAAALGKGAIVEEGAVLGDEVTVGAGALVRPRVKIYPSRSVEAGAIVTQSVVRERRASRSLFGARGVSGIVNVGVTPQVAVRLGMAYGTTLKRGSVVVTGRDASRAARTMKRAVIAGLTSTGVTCHDLELMPMPVTRFAVRSEQAAGGIGFRTSARDEEVVEIRLFDSDGTDLPESSQRKIDRIFFREDYRRPGHARLGELEFPPHVVEQYASGLLRALDVDAVRRAHLKVVVDYAFGPASLVGPSIVGRLGCDVLALNAFTDEHRPTLLEEDLDRLLRRLSQQVSNSGSDLGVLLEPGGEIAHIVDDRGVVVGHDRALLAFVQHEASRGNAVAVPVSASLQCERLVEQAGGKLYWTPTAWPALMARAARDEIGFAGNAEGALIFPGFMPAPDGLMTFGKTLELTAVSGRRLGQLVDDLPAAHVVRRAVRTPWQHKGAVMRRVASTSVPGRLMLLDGVKAIEHDRWALVIPDPDEPLCIVWAEAPSAGESAEHADRFARRVETIVAERSS
jgi:mannose-1-phosphate guanylyltransferase/phosphomannomutase